MSRTDAVQGIALNNVRLAQKSLPDGQGEMYTSFYRMLGVLVNERDWHPWASANDTPLVVVQAYDTAVRAFFDPYGMGFIPTVTINAHAFQFGLVWDTAESFAHEMVHWFRFINGDRAWADHSDAFHDRMMDEAHTERFKRACEDFCRVPLVHPTFFDDNRPA